MGVHELHGGPTGDGGDGDGDGGDGGGGLGTGGDHGGAGPEVVSKVMPVPQPPVLPIPKANKMLLLVSPEPSGHSVFPRFGFVHATPSALSA